MKKDDLFGPHRVKTVSQYKNDSRYEFTNEMNKIADWCCNNLRSMHTYPGPAPGEVVWCFQDEDDAVLFTLKWA